MTSLETTLHKGFETTATALAKEVSLFPVAWKNLTDEKVREDLVSAVKSPHVKELVAEGRIKEAIASLNDQTKLVEEIAVLLLSQDEQDWIKALELIEANRVEMAKYFLTLAYRFWSIGKLEMATELAEKGLNLATAQENVLYVSKFKNSLAYYYADSQRGFSRRRTLRTSPQERNEFRVIRKACRTRERSAAATQDVSDLALIRITIQHSSTTSVRRSRFI